MNSTILETAINLFGFPIKSSCKKKGECICQSYGKDKTTHHCGELTKVKKITSLLFGKPILIRAYSCQNHLNTYLVAGWREESRELKENKNSMCMCIEYGIDKSRKHAGIDTQVRYGKQKPILSCDNHLHNYLSNGWEFIE